MATMATMPKFLANEVDVDQLSLIGRLTSTTNGVGTPVTSGQNSYLRQGDAMVPGQWTQADTTWVFTAVIISEFPDGIEPFREFEVWDGHWGQMADTVLDPALDWEHRRWSSRDDPHDHHHCKFCWKKISGRPGTEQDFFQAARPEGFATAVACTACYTRFVAPHSLDFTTVGGPASDSGLAGT